MNWIVAVSGKVKSAVQRVAKPNAAPAEAYVPMPEGSSSDAPVMNPGPRRPRNRFNGDRRAAVTVARRTPWPASPQNMHRAQECDHHAHEALPRDDARRHGDGVLGGGLRLPLRERQREAG